jgi:hypothetical protein
MLLISYLLERKKKKKISYCTSLFIDVTKGSLHKRVCTFENLIQADPKILNSVTSILQVCFFVPHFSISIHIHN